MEDDEIWIGPRPEKYLDLRPVDTYDENIEALGNLSEGEYDTVGEAYQDLHPRVYHSTFSEFYQQAVDTAKVDSEALEDMQELLDEKQEEDHFWIEDKLFNLGYALGPKNNRRNRRSRRRQRQNPGIAHGRDMMPDFESPLPGNPVREGRQKRVTDEYYAFAGLKLNAELRDLDIEI